MSAEAQMQLLGEHDGARWYWAAPGMFHLPGVYYWDGGDNVRVEKARPAPSPQPAAPVGPKCRDCADFGPICPNSGKPCNSQPQPAVPVVSKEQIESCALAAGFSIEPSTGAIWAVDGYGSTRVDPGLRKFARAILALRPAVEPMTDEVRRSYQCLLAMNTPHGFGDRIGPFVKWLQDSGITAKAEDAHQPTKEAEKP